MKKLLDSVRKAFCLEGNIIDWCMLTDGGIHETYRVRTEKKAYIFQQMNTNVFSCPEAVMQNIAAVTACLQKQFPDKQTLHVYQTAEQAYLYQHWRVMDCIDGYSMKTCENGEQIYQAGKAFGIFQRELSGLPAEQLVQTIPAFHDTRAYFRKFLELDSHTEEAERLKSWQKQACFVFDCYQAENIPLQVTHNDMKCSNLLFDDITHLPVAVIDLDTVMPGMAVYDFGDAVRSFSARTGSSEADLTKVGIDMRKLQSFVSGWLSVMQYTEPEKKLLPYAVFSVTAELAVRYLTDYLQGNHYFPVTYPEQNLIRARNQIRLAQDILNHQKEISSVIYHLS